MRDFLHFSYFEIDRMVSQCECTAQWREINELATTRRRRHDDEATTRRRRGDDEATTTRRRHDERNANTGPTPDPNYKREPFATHSGKKLSHRSNRQRDQWDHGNSLEFLKSSRLPILKWRLTSHVPHSPQEGRLCLPKHERPVGKGTDSHQDLRGAVRHSVRAFVSSAIDRFRCCGLIKSSSVLELRQWV